MTSIESPRPATQESKRFLVKVFLAALAIRWAYALVLYHFMGDDGLKGVDSITYAIRGSEFAEALRAGAIHGPQWFGKDFYSMPLFYWLGGLPFLIAGKVYGTLGYVFMQGAFDAGTCVLVSKIGSQFSKRIAIPAGIIAIANPTQIVMSGLFYADTIFVFFATLAIYNALQWLDEPAWRRAVWLGLAFGLAALVRNVIVPWGLFALVLMTGYVAIRRISLARTVTIAAAFAGLTLGVGVILLKNYTVFGTAGLTAQTGIHTALWIVPLAKEMQDRTPYMSTVKEIERRTIARFGPHPDNPFEQSKQYSIIAKEALKDIPVTAIVKSWLSGMTINLLSPAVLLSPTIANLPRTSGFYDTPGDSFLGKILNYAFRSGQPVYMWCLLIGGAGLLAVRLLQAFGAVALAPRSAKWPQMFLMASWAGYILLVSGPVASPKYRLPLEPAFDILSGAGVVAIGDRRFKRKSDVIEQSA